MRVYLAGKIAKNDWRHSIVGPLLRAADGNAPWAEERIQFGGGHTYVGPFFVGCDHGCSHSFGEHGLLRERCTSDAGEGPPWRRPLPAPDPLDVTTSVRRGMTHTKCLEAIDAADLVFAWLDDTTAHGTLWELGYAAARGKETAIGIPEGFDATELWFAVHGAGQFWVAKSSAEAFERSAYDVQTRLAYDLCESPIERELAAHLFGLLPDGASLTAQHPVLRYRLDFALVGSGRKIAIECDGHDFHEKTKAQAAKDKKRDRDLQAAGWRVLRFTGSEIHRDAGACAREAVDLYLKMRPEAAE